MTHYDVCEPCSAPHDIMSWLRLRVSLQDMCTRVWDLRKPNESTVVLCGRLGAVRSLRYSPDGRLLAASEPADFVQLYDVTSGYTRY